MYHVHLSGICDDLLPMYVHDMSEIHERCIPLMPNSGDNYIQVVFLNNETNNMLWGERHIYLFLYIWFNLWIERIIYCRKEEKRKKKKESHWAFERETCSWLRKASEVCCIALWGKSGSLRNNVKLNVTVDIKDNSIVSD